LVAIVLTIISSGCQAEKPGSQTPKEKYAILKISVLDAKTRKIIPTSSWKFAEEINSPKPARSVTNWMYREEKYERIFDRLPPGSYEATASANGYLLKHKEFKVKPGTNKVYFFLELIPPQKSEQSVYATLKKKYPLKIYRPRYLPAGFRISPYAGEPEAKKPNPYIQDSEALVVYNKGGERIELIFGALGDVGMQEPSKIYIAGKRTYIFEEKGRVDIVWQEDISGKTYLYAVRGVGVLKEEVIKVAKSLYLVN
jgi:hypothetical protein